MEDVKFDRSHSNSPLPEAGHDPGDPVRPEVDEENADNPPIGGPYQDMDATETEEKIDLPDEADLEAGLSDNESVLSDLDDAQFEDFDPGNIAVEERPAQALDDSNLNQIGVHKRARAEGEGDQPKKKRKKADKPRRKKNRDADEDLGDVPEAGSRKSRRSKREGRARGASPEDDNEENLTPEERRKRAFERAMDAAVKGSSTRRRKKGEIDLDQMADAEIEDMRKRMAAAAEADNNGRQRGEPARHKLKLLPEVTALLNKNTLREAIVDPETNLLEAVRFFLEPLSDGSLPAYDIQKDLFAALAKLPINKESLVASGIGKVIMFYIKSKRPELVIKRQAERLFTDWTRPILRRTDDYRKKEFAQADFDPTQLAVRPNPNSQAAIAEERRKKALETPRTFLRARMEAGPTTYTVVPKSNFIYNDQVKNRGAGGGEDILRKMRARGGRGGR